MKPMLTEETAELVRAVAKSNPGALSLTQRLCHRTRWFEIMHYCKKHGIVGETLWELYAGTFQHDLYALGDYLEQKWREELHGW